MIEYSFVIPCYKSALSIRDVVNEIDREMVKGKIENYEIIMVNDNSPDDTWEILKQLSKETDNRICIDLSRNFGQHAALMAGFHYCSGKYVITVDDDLQTPIEKIWLLKAKMDEGYDIVSARYNVREGFSIKRQIGTMMNRLMIRWLVGMPNNATVSVFLMAKKFVIEEMIKYEQPYPYISGLAVRTTHNIANVEMDQNNRVYGASGYSFHKLLKLWINGFTAFSLKPLRIADFLGIITAICGFIMGGTVIVRKLINPAIAMGWSSIVSLLLIIGGVIMLMLGLIGEYIGRIYMCINNTPQYIIRDICSGKQMINEK